MDKTYDELTTALSSHLAPKPLVIAERFRFHKREQKEGESIKAYAASLQKLAEHCNFVGALTETLRDRLVCGMRNETVQKRLLAKEDLTYAKALELAETEERASKDAEQLHSRAQQEVHRVRQFRPALRPEGKDKGPANCNRCGGKHEQHVCKFRFETCRYCKKKGHIVRVHVS